MPHTQGDVAEKRVLMQSTTRKTNLRRAHEKITLEEKSFMSSAQFDKRLILNKQAKFQQLRSKQNGNENSKYSGQSNLPYITGGDPRSNHSSSYGLATPATGKDVETPIRRKPLDLEFGKEQITTHSLRTVNKRRDKVERTRSDPSSEIPFESRLERGQSNLKDVARSKQYVVDDLEDAECAGRVNPPVEVDLDDLVTHGGSQRKDWERIDEEEVKVEPEGFHFSQVFHVQQFEIIPKNPPGKVDWCPLMKPLSLLFCTTPSLKPLQLLSLNRSVRQTFHETNFVQKSEVVHSSLLALNEASFPFVGIRIPIRQKLR